MMNIARLSALLTLLALPVAASDETPSPAAQAVPTVTVVAAKTAEVEQRVSISGSLVARDEVQVFPQVSGFEITELLVEAGDTVTKGQPLARLSQTTLSAQLAQAQAEYQRADAAVAQATSQIASAEATLNQANAALERARSLRSSGNTPQATLDQAIAAQASAQAGSASARDGVAVARAGLAQAAAAQDIAQMNLDRTVITAPVAGFVSARNGRVGALSGASADPLFVLIADNDIETQGEVIENALSQLAPGQDAILSVVGVGQIDGKVRLVPASVDPVTRLGVVRVSMPKNAALRTGMFAKGDIITARRQAVTVPVSAVLSDDDGDRVQVIRDGKVETRPVDTGVVWNGLREITKGIQDGELVMLRAGAFFRTGDPVQTVAEAPLAAAGPAE